MGKYELKELVDELIQKISELNAKLYPNSGDLLFSTADAYNTENLILKIKEKVFSTANLDNQMLAVIATYFESKKERLKEVIKLYYPTAAQEALDTMIYDIYHLYCETFKSHAAGVSYAEIDLEVLLRLSHEDFISKLSAPSQLISEINILLDPFIPLHPGIDHNSADMPYKTLIQKLIYTYKCYTSAFTPEAEVIEDQEDFEIFLKQCICIVDMLTANISNSTDIKQQLIASLPQHQDRANNLVALLSQWLESPVLSAMQDWMIPINKQQFLLKSYMHKIKSAIKLNNIIFCIIGIINYISKITGVAIDDALAQELNIQTMTQIHHLFLISAIARLVDKVHQDHGTYEERMNFTVVLAEILSCDSNPNDLLKFKASINAIEEAIAFAIKFDFSFKELLLRDHHPRLKLKC